MCLEIIYKNGIRHFITNNGWYAIKPNQKGLGPLIISLKNTLEWLKLLYFLNFRVFALYFVSVKKIPFALIIALQILGILPNSFWIKVDSKPCQAFFKNCKSSLLFFGDSFLTLLSNKSHNNSIGEKS